MKGESSIKRKLLSGSAWALLGKIVFAVATLLINAMLSRLLAPGEMGDYFSAFNLALFGSTIGILGLNQSIVRFVAESMSHNRPSRAKRAVTLSLGLALLGSALIFGLYMAAQWALSGYASDGTSRMLAYHLPVAGWIAVSVFQQLTAEIFRGFHDIHYASLFSGLLSNLLLVAGLGGLMLGGAADLPAVLGLVIASTAVSIVSSLWLLRRKLSRLGEDSAAPEGQEALPALSAAHMVKVSLPIMISAVTMFLLTQSDIWILGLFESKEEVAVYGAAFRFVAILGLTEIVTNAVIPSLIVEMHTKGRLAELEKMCRSVTTLAAIPALALLLIFIGLGRPLLGIVYSPFYEQGVVVLVILSAARVLHIMSGPAMYALMLSGHQRTMMQVTLLSSALTVAGGLAAARYFGSIGIAVVMACGLLFYDVLMVLQTKRHLGIWTYASADAFRTGAEWLRRFRTKGEKVGENG